MEFEIEVNKKEHEKEDIIDYLKYVIAGLKKGEKSGDGWTLMEVEL